MMLRGNGGWEASAPSLLTLLNISLGCQIKIKTSSLVTNKGTPGLTFNLTDHVSLKLSLNLFLYLDLYISLGHIFYPKAPAGLQF